MLPYAKDFAGGSDGLASLVLGIGDFISLNRRGLSFYLQG